LPVQSLHPYAFTASTTSKKSATTPQIKAAALVSIRVSSYEDIIKAQKQRDFREAGVKAGQRQWHSKRYQSMPAQVIEEILSG
jgi:hypothetical protein